MENKKREIETLPNGLQKSYLVWHPIPQPAPLQAFERFNFQVAQRNKIVP